jgi:Arm DNA-binding domain
MAHQKRALDDRYLKALKKRPAAEGRTYDVMDTIVPSFGVRVSDKGRCTFILIARYGYAKNPTRRALGVYDALTLENARIKARKWIEQLQKGEDPALQEERDRERNIERQKTTFGAVAEDFHREKLPGERKGEDVWREIRRDLLPRWENLPISDITDLHVLSVIKAKKPDGKVGARNLLALIKRFFRWAVAQRIYGISVSPAATLQASAILGEMKGSRERILSNDEIFAYWRASQRMPYPYGPAYQSLMLTALRLNEVTDASETEFDRRDKLWVIPAERMKGKNSGKKQARAHAVPLTNDFLAVLDALPRFKGGKYLFSTTSGRSPTWVGTKVKARLDGLMLEELRALAKSRGADPDDVELPHFVNHDIRRTVRSQLSRLKVTEEAREAVLAHARPGIKGTYDLHDYLDEKREALELWAARLRSIVEPATASNVIALHAKG